MINKAINQAIRDSLNSTTVDLDALNYFAKELSKITIYSYWSQASLDVIHKILYDDTTGVFEDVADYLLEFNTHLIYNLTGEQYQSLVLAGGGGLQALTREVLIHSPSIISPSITNVTVNNIYNISEAQMDRLSTLIFILRLHIVTLYREIENRLNK